MTPASVNLPTHKRGDIWPGMTVGPMSPQPTYALVSCRLQFRGAKSKNTLGYEFSSAGGDGKGTIGIVSAAGYHIQFPEQALPLKAGDYIGDLETVDSQGKVRTYIEFHLTVAEDWTYG